MVDNDFSMLEELVETYLDDLNFPDEFYGRIYEIIRFYVDIGYEIERIFISEYINADDQRVYENLWLFSDGRVMEAKNFIVEDDFDSLPTANFVYWNIKKENYDFKKANNESRMYLDYSGSDLMSLSEFKASKGNCDYLRDAFLHIKNNNENRL